MAWYDDEGFVVDNTIASIDGLPPDGSARFRANGPYDPSAVSCDVIEVYELGTDNG